jgi:hypothetical protein
VHNATLPYLFRFSDALTYFSAYRTTKWREKVLSALFEMAGDGLGHCRSATANSGSRKSCSPLLWCWILVLDDGEINGENMARIWRENMSTILSVGLNSSGIQKLLLRYSLE